MSPQESVILHQFKQYCSLSAEEEALLLELERDPRKVSAGEIIWPEDAKADQFCTVRQGWAYSFRTLGDGSRQILKIYLPGDIIGMRDFAFYQRLAGVAMIEDGVICPFSHQQLLDIFQNSAALTAGLFAMACRQQATLTERLIYMGRRTALQRLAHFLYEMYVRLDRIGAVEEGRFNLPLSQEQLGDALGLSSVHVSRTFTAFRDEGLVLRDRHRVTLLDPKALAAMAEFNDGYLNDRVPAVFLDEEWRDSPSLPSSATEDGRAPEIAADQSRSSSAE